MQLFTTREAVAAFRQIPGAGCSTSAVFKPLKRAGVEPVGAIRHGKSNVNVYRPEDVERGAVLIRRSVSDWRADVRKMGEITPAILPVVPFSNEAEFRLK